MRMRKHPKKHRRISFNKARAKPRTKPARSRSELARPRVPPTDDGGFLSLFLQRIGWEELATLNQRKHEAGRPTHRLSRGQLLIGLVFHYTVGWAGTLGEHLFCFLGIQMAESTLSERRQALPFEVFADLLRRVLRPIAEAGPQALFGQWRLVALDGIVFSLAKTRQVNRRYKKGGNQNGRAAFAKLQCAALVELALHNPLAALVGRAGVGVEAFARAVGTPARAMFAFRRPALRLWSVSGGRLQAAAIPAESFPGAGQGEPEGGAHMRAVQRW